LTSRCLSAKIYIVIYTTSAREVGFDLLKFKNKNHNKIIDKTSFTPVYYQLVKILEKEILNGMMPGDALPTEHEISVHFGISRMTVRRAIAQLVQAGMVYAEKGRGTFVAKPQLDNLIFELDGFYAETQQKDMNPNSKLLEVRIVKADENIFKKSSIPIGTRCLYFRVVRKVGSEPLIYETKHIVYSKKKPLLEAELLNSTWSNLVANNGNPPVRSQKTLQVKLLNDHEAKALQVSPITPAFSVEQVFYDIDNNPLGWGISLYRGDRYKITSHAGWAGENYSKGVDFENEQ